MLVVLEITSGPSAGKKFWLRALQSADVGRGDQAAFVVPHDQRMSARHFHVECDGRQCQLRDLNSRNGTTVNGRKVAAAVLQDSDVIVVGKTCFRVHIEGGAPPEPAAPAAVSGDAVHTAPALPATGPQQRAGRWMWNIVPQGWEMIPGQGMRNVAKGEFPTSLMFAESTATANISLSQHVETLIRQYLDALPGCRAERPAAAEVKGAEEAIQFLLLFPERGDVALRQRHLCVCQGDRIGMAVLTTSQAELEKSGGLIDRVLAGLAWEKTPVKL